MTDISRIPGLPASQINDDDKVIVFRNGEERLTRFKQISQQVVAQVPEPEPVIGGDVWEQPAGSPIILAAGEEFEQEHASVVNEKMLVTASKLVDNESQTDISLDFDTEDSGKFEFNNTQIEFADGVVKLKGSGGGDDVEYPVDTNCQINTNATGDISLDNIANLEAITIIDDAPEGCSLRYLFSFDGGNTCYRWNVVNEEWEAKDLADIDTDGNISDDLVDAPLSSAVLPGTPSSLRVYANLWTENASLTPSIDQITVEKLVNERYDPATVGPYGSSTDIGMRRTGPSTTKFKNQTVGELSVFINIITPAPSE